jgi:hypothetical protein
LPPTPNAINEFLHRDPERVYNPFTDAALVPGDRLWDALTAFGSGEAAAAALPDGVLRELQDGLWIVPEGRRLEREFRLKYVSLEAHTVCNQACFFCPVSFEPRAPYYMPTALYERIVTELSEFKETIDAVCMINYNEPTADRRFVDQVRTLKSAGLPPAVLTNGSGLTPDRVDAILALGGLRYLSVNLSTLDRERYAKDRGADQLPLVLKNLVYAKEKPLATEMEVIVLGQGDDAHRVDHERITEWFSKSLFTVRPLEVMDRAGYLPVGLRPAAPHKSLAGCENLGSRPLQHIHITPHGRCVLCCEDYQEKYVVGDLTTRSVRDVLTGPEIAALRRWVYGVDDAPDDFLCRKCVFARTR